MFDPDPAPNPTGLSPDGHESGLFLWRGAGIVLMGEVENGRWIVVRGWTGPDTLTDVRRWSFVSPAAFCGQIRRLVHEATGNHRAATLAATLAETWATPAPARAE